VKATVAPRSSAGVGRVLVGRCGLLAYLEAQSPEERVATFAHDPSATMTRLQAQAYFERRGAATIAHTLTAQDTLQVTAACPSCEYLTDKLCVGTIRRPPPDMS
jgi:hypothetical protein